MRRRLTIPALLAALSASVWVSACGTEPGPLAPAGEPSAGLIGDAVDLTGSLLGLELLQAQEVIPVDSARAVIGPEGGTLEIPGGHRITFPAGALSEPVAIRARVGGDRTIRVRFAPHGLTFPADRAPTLALSYQRAGLLGFLSPGGLAIVYLDDRDRILENWLGALNPLGGTVTTRIGHFSSYALASN